MSDEEKYNEIQLTKNEMELNNLSMKIHPPSHIQSLDSGLYVKYEELPYSR